jgi:FKBP-type peptidyl-prolyl cis-trans isomerase
MSYVREQNSNEVYLAKIDDDVSTKFIDWVEPDLLKIKKEDITSIKVSDYSVDEVNGRIEERSQTTLVKHMDKDEWASPEAPADKRVAKTAIDKLLGDITGLRLANIRPFAPDPQMLRECGFYLVGNKEIVERPDAYVVSAGDNQKLAVVPNEGEIAVTSKDGLRYRIFFGEIALDEKDGAKKPESAEGEEKKDDKKEGHDRYMVVFCQYDPASDQTPKDEPKADPNSADAAKPKDKAKKPNGQDRADRAQERFLKFFYVISNASFESLRPKADTLLEAKPVEAMAGDSGMTNAQRFEANSKKLGVTTTASGLQYEVISAGKPNGKQPTDQDEVSVNYKGTLVVGTEFDASKDAPATFGVTGVIKGWTEALKLMHEGDKWRLFIPPELAYGKDGSPPKIGPDQILIFEVELVKVGK